MAQPKKSGALVARVQATVQRKAKRNWIDRLAGSQRAEFFELVKAIANGSVKHTLMQCSEIVQQHFRIRKISPKTIREDLSRLVSDARKIKKRR